MAVIKTVTIVVMISVMIKMILMPAMKTFTVEVMTVVIMISFMMLFHSWGP